LAKINRRPAGRFRDPDYRRGRAEGLALGKADGHWQGMCEYAVRKAEPVPAKRPVRVLYVTSGKGFPYSPLDDGIIASLKEVAEQVTIAAPHENVAEIAAKESPHLLLALDGMQLALEKVYAVNELGIRTAVWFTDDPYYSDMTGGIAQHYFHVFTLERNCVPFYLERGCPRVSYLPLGVFPEAYRPRNTDRSIRGDVCFIGSAYWNRIALFDRLMPLIAHRSVYISGMWWDRLAEYDRWKHCIELGKWMGPLPTSERYAAHKIVINSHRAFDDDTFNRNSAMIRAASPNPRTFEISASATLQLTDVREDIEQHYVPGKEIVTYDSPEDLAAKAEYYLIHEEERREIALRGLYRTMKDHTYVSRLSRMLDLAMQT